jgi:hypothetical protein
MPRENSFTDSEGRSLTPDLEEGMELERAFQAQVDRELTQSPPPAADLGASAATSATAGTGVPPASTTTPSRKEGAAHLQIPMHGHRPPTTPGDRFRASVRKVMQLHRTSTMLSMGSIGAEPGIDVKRADADRQYGRIRQECTIEIIDYNGMTSSARRMDNAGFVKMMQDPRASKPEPWIKVRVRNPIGSRMTLND